ncbi:hypothetical protein SNEBB_007443 [Seison nebaliae]|nr:hypothetical protein SNEBB_007443 [Seison nebaliae]
MTQSSILRDDRKKQQKSIVERKPVAVSVPVDNRENKNKNPKDQWAVDMRWIEHLNNLERNRRNWQDKWSWMKEETEETTNETLNSINLEETSTSVMFTENTPNTANNVYGARLQSEQGQRIKNIQQTMATSNAIRKTNFIPTY